VTIFWTQCSGYFRLWSVPLYHIFPHYLRKARRPEKVIEHKICFNFLYKHCLKYRVIRNYCRGINNLSYTIHLR
jgi:hypothetical protein